MTLPRNVPKAMWWLGGLAGLGYGLLVRMFISSALSGGIFSIMSVGFLFVVPFVMGHFTVAPTGSTSLAFRIVAPWWPTLLATGIAMALGWEGMICFVMALPLLLGSASLGGLTAPRQAPPSQHFVLAGLAPIVLMALEGRTTPTAEYATVRTTIDIAAPPPAVWRQIVSVPPIAPSELDDALFLRLGFPRPVSAIVEGHGPGAIRQARFEGGVLFLETVTEWTEPTVLSFRIAAQTDSIPPTTLDPHVTIGGPFFDVLTGTYRLEPLPGDSTRLHLESELRLSTRFNWYAGPWARAIMASIQKAILRVERTRAESIIPS